MADKRSAEMNCVYAVTAVLIIISVALIVPLSAVASKEASREIPTSAEVTNIAPAILSLGLEPDDDPTEPGVQIINPDPEENKTVTLTVIVSDKNGYYDISDVIAEFEGPDFINQVVLIVNRSINVSTSEYKGEFNLSNHKEGEYKVIVKAKDKGGLESSAEMNFTYSYGIKVMRYDFSEGAGEDKWAYQPQCAGFPPDRRDVPSVEFTSSQYSRIRSRNYIMHVSVTSENGFHAAHRFVFHLKQPPESITMMNISWYGFGFKFLGDNGATMFVWNCTAGRYERIDSDDSIFARLHGVITSSASHYIDDKGDITILVEQNSPQTHLLWWALHSFLGTDYIYLDVHYHPLTAENSRDEGGGL